MTYGNEKKKDEVLKSEDIRSDCENCAINS